MPGPAGTVPQDRVRPREQCPSLRRSGGAKAVGSCCSGLGRKDGGDCDQI